MKNFWIYATAFLCAVMLALQFIDIKDADGAEDAANRYCRMVYLGHWPDYQQNYLEFCKKDKWNGK